MLYVNRILRIIRRDILRDPFLIEMQRWFDADGDNLLRYKYPLNADSIVWDLGGYLGDYTYQIRMKYNSKVYLFEPIPKFYESCSQRFQNDQNVVCLPFGLSNHTGESLMNENDDKSSFEKPNDNTSNNVIARLESVTETFENLGTNQIDLLKINIEGGEYDVLEALLNAKLMTRIRFLQVQFHKYAPQSAVRRSRIRNDLSLTHREMWNYPFVWESWELKEKK